MRIGLYEFDITGNPHVQQALVAALQHRGIDIV